MSKIEVNKIGPQCGTTLTVGCGAGQTVVADAATVTLGRCGGTVALASGATQTGFGRNGSVNWQTTIKTANFTAASGEGYFCDTASVGAFTLTLPSSPSVGDIVALKDYASNFATANLTIGRGGSNLNGSAQDNVRDTDNESLTLVYADATKGWIPVEEGTGFIGETFITATGGTVTCSGNFKIHTFTGPGTFCVSSAGIPSNNSIDYLVVAGGGGGECNPSQGQGGGGGGFRLSNSTCMPAPLTSPLANPTGITATVAAFPITVGGAGAINGNGNTSTFSTITSAGGGGGNGNNGGSGAGGGGSGNTPPVSPPQGQNGGPGGHAGGGGAGATGGAFSPPNSGGTGGDGSFVLQAGFAGCNGTPGPVGSTRYFAGGGAGGYPVGRPSGIPGGAGGGGTGGEGAVCGTAGATNTGGGGGGSANSSPGAKAGGSGIVIIRYKYQ